MLGDSKTAKGALKIASDTGSDLPPSEIRVLYGLLALNNGEYDKFVEISQEVLSKDEHHIGARALLASAGVRVAGANIRHLLNRDAVYSMIYQPAGVGRL